MTTATDIEIYVPMLTTEEASAWLLSVFPEFVLEKKKKGIPKSAQPFRVVWLEQSIFGIIYEGAVSGFTSIWLDSNQLPWPDDEACAVAAAKQLKRAVRFTSGWQQQDNPDAWFEVTEDAVKTDIIWHTE